ncbi:hypothetical protein [Polyangium jinanense]|uniref:Tryptophan synthase alpha chain n=1 Tax=Polyangium jinanense TaxID=2829994 RepID=A0A9X3X4H8_9BACT|nr:hypothetical protein [Polyangium jinanense]MDC3957213.1 hypothetical protein [Polyangium jinanense]MDC3982615.1 hypothetical protein [Polyangium jinanense]
MHRHVFVLFGLSISILAAACAPKLVAPGGNGGAGGAGGISGPGGTGGMPECSTQADCPDTECRIGGSCNAGTCDYTTAIMPGTPVGAQVYGDCKQRECDASGAVTQVDTPADVYKWAADSCRKDDCEAWLNPQPASGACMTKWDRPGICDDSFNCIECTKNEDCAGLLCDPSIGMCVPFLCGNGSYEAGNGETDIDCGGSCAPCAVGLKCNSQSDCEGRGACVGSPKTCQAPACNDGFHNGDETSTDCGGACAQDMASPKKCPQGQGCLVANDCQAGLSCISGTCQL